MIQNSSRSPLGTNHFCLNLGGVKIDPDPLSRLLRSESPPAFELLILESFNTLSPNISRKIIHY